MSNQLPVPSKGALRALRHLAFGTSCTVGLSAGLLTEDRRRRIHAAQAIQQNGEKIKGSKAYNGSAGAVAIAAMEDHVLAPEYFHEERRVIPPTTTWKSEAIATHYAHDTRSSTPPIVEASPATERPMNEKPQQADSSRVTTNPRDLTSHSISRTVAQHASVHESDPARHNSFVSCRTLKFMGDEPNLERDKRERVYQLYQKYRRGLGTRRMIRRMKVYEEAMMEFISNARDTPIAESVYNRIRAPEYALELLHREAGDWHTEKNLEMAFYIFMTPRLESKSFEKHDLVLILSRKLFKAGRLEELLKVCARAGERRFEQDVEQDVMAELYALQVKAANILRKKQLADTTFTKSLIPALGQTTNNQSFNVYLELALDAALTFSWESPAREEQLLCAARQAALTRGFVISTVPFLGLLGRTWRTNRNLDEIVALFDRLSGDSGLFDVVDEPHALYSLMAQYCLEAGDEQLAEHYRSWHLKFTENSEPSLKMRGHLAYQAAKSGDWEQVKLQMKEMIDTKDGGKDTREQVSESFNPIFALFAESHTIGETKNFLKNMVQRGLKLHPHASNKMVQQIAESQDIESCSEWLKYAKQHGVEPNSSTCNALAAAHRSANGASFGKLVEVYESWHKLSPSIPDHVGVDILRTAAAREADGNANLFNRLDARVKALSSSSLADKPKIETEWRDNAPYAQMLAAVNKGSIRRAVDIFDILVEDETKASCVTPRVVALAVKSCLLLKHNTSEAANLQRVINILKTGISKGIDITPGVSEYIAHRVKDPNLNAEDTIGILNDCTAVFRKQGIELEMGVVNKTVDLISDRGGPQTAFLLWKYYAERYGLDSKDFSIVDLTILLKLHIKLNDTDGIESVMEVLSENNLRPDKEFKEVLMKNLRLIKKRLKLATEPGRDRNLKRAFAKDKLLYTVLYDSLSFVMEKRQTDQQRFKDAEQMLLGIMSEAAQEAQLA